MNSEGLTQALLAEASYHTGFSCQVFPSMKKTCSGINLGSWANCLLEPFYSLKEVEDLGALKRETPRRKGQKFFKGLSNRRCISQKVLPHLEAPGTAASNGVLVNLDEGKI